MSRPKRSWWALALRDPILVSMVMLYLVGVGLFLAYLGSLQQKLYQASALENAELYSDAIKEFRTLYTREVVSRARRFGIAVSHDYATIDHAIPLPATLSMRLGQEISKGNSGAKLYLYSPYPFPWRVREHKARFESDLDGSPSFAQRAWQHWESNPQDQGAYSEFVDGKLYYATADRMRAACVSCHNQHPDSPKRDWGVGDVRGVLQVTNPTASLSAQSQADLTGAYLFAAVFALGGGSLIFAMMGRSRRTARQLETRVRELAIWGEELESARNDADVAVQAKSRFVANISHEIRTPMNAVIGLTEVMLDQGMEDTQRENLELVNQSARELLELVNQILDFSKLEAGLLPVSMVSFELHRTLENIKELLEPLARSKGIQLDLVVDPKTRRTYVGDALKLRQILLNLASNALKFTVDGRVEIRSEYLGTLADGQHLRLSVRDSGVGIPLANQPSIFKPFNQVDNSSTRAVGGTGLGLSISKQLTEQLGGEIGCESEMGKGTLFWITLPLGLATSVSSKASSHPLDPSPSFGRESRRILVAEDHPVNQRVARLLLERMGHNVVVVADGQEAVRAWHSDAFDLILMDCQMPFMDGYAATREIRRQEQASQELVQIPIVAMTAGISEHERRSCLEAGMDEFLTKPIAAKDLRLAIDQHLNSET